MGCETSPRPQDLRILGFEKPRLLRDGKERMWQWCYYRGVRDIRTPVSGWLWVGPCFLLLVFITFWSLTKWRPEDSISGHLSIVLVSLRHAVSTIQLRFTMWPFHKGWSFLLNLSRPMIYTLFRKTGNSNTSTQYSIPMTHARASGDLVYFLGSALLAATQMTSSHNS